MKFRPCIDILSGKVRQIVGGSLNSGNLITNFVSEKPSIYYAKIFKKNGLKGGHIIMLDATEETKKEALKALQTYPGGMQIGGGITPENAQEFLEAGASRIIISSYIFEDKKLSQNRLDQLVNAVGRERLVLDLSCRRKNGRYYVVINKWQTFIDFEVNLDNLKMLSKYCSEFLIYGVDVEGKKQGIDKKLLDIICQFTAIPITYAGGIKDSNDIEIIRQLGKGKIDFTVGSALDIFGGNMKYETCRGQACLSPTMGAWYVHPACLPPTGLTKRIIACMDIKEGRVVKGINFTQLKDAGDPVELGKLYSDQGADELVFLDIMATVENRNTFYELVERIAKNINIPFTVGGGIKTINDIRSALNAGADKVSIGSAAVTNPDFVKKAANEFGSQCIVISIDPKKRENGSWEIYIKGGREPTGVDAIKFAKQMEKLGAGELLVNSLDRDGMKTGYDIPLLRAISNAVNIPIIASSGAGKKEDFLEAFEEGGCDAALAASLFHYREIDIGELKEYLKEKGILVR